MGLRELRRKRDLTLEALAVLAGVDIGTISRIERRQTRARPETVVRLARGLRISALRMKAILDGGDDEPPTGGAAPADHSGKPASRASSQQAAVGDWE